MANLSTVRETLETYLKSYWGYTPIAWDNVPFDAPNGKSWIRPAVIVDISENINLGAVHTSSVRHSGQYITQIFSPLNQGSGDHYRLVDQLILLLQNKQLEANILTYAGTVRRIGDEGNGWFQSNVFIPFTADQI